jgi:hypothetical protein
MSFKGAVTLRATSPGCLQHLPCKGLVLECNSDTPTGRHTVAPRQPNHGQRASRIQSVEGLARQLDSAGPASAGQCGKQRLPQRHRQRQALGKGIQVSHQLQRGGDQQAHAQGPGRGSRWLEHRLGHRHRWRRLRCRWGGCLCLGGSRRRRRRGGRLATGQREANSKKKPGNRFDVCHNHAARLRRFFPCIY